eukprot:GHVQ01030143.1.p1 GENE.GHVQ01030143.1~~GHVQ01030143.1.p1  ORF type:complete len:335 (-),score=46.30 GHVQ01030143.1:182-1120(-)
MLYPIFLFLLVILSHSIYPSYTHTHHTHSLVPIGFLPAEAAPIPPAKDEKSGGGGCVNTVEVMPGAASDPCVLQLKSGQLSPGVDEEAEVPKVTGRLEKSGGPEASEAGGRHKGSDEWPTNSVIRHRSPPKKNRSSLGDKFAAPLDRDSTATVRTPMLSYKGLCLMSEALQDEALKSPATLGDDDPPSAVTPQLASLLRSHDQAETAEGSDCHASFIGVTTSIEGRKMLPRITRDVVTRLAVVLLDLHGPAVPIYDDTSNWVGHTLSWVPVPSTFQEDQKLAFPRIVLRGQNGERKTVFKFGTRSDQELQVE